MAEPTISKRVPTSPPMPLSGPGLKSPTKPVTKMVSGAMTPIRQKAAQPPVANSSTVHPRAAAAKMAMAAGGGKATGVQSAKALTPHRFDKQGIVPPVANSSIVHPRAAEREWMATPAAQKEAAGVQSAKAFTPAARRKYEDAAPKPKRRGPKRGHGHKRM